MAANAARPRVEFWRFASVEFREKPSEARATGAKRHDGSMCFIDEAEIVLICGLCADKGRNTVMQRPLLYGPTQPKPFVPR